MISLWWLLCIQQDLGNQRVRVSYQKPTYQLSDSWRHPLYLLIPTWTKQWMWSLGIHWQRCQPLMIPSTTSQKHIPVVDKSVTRWESDNLRGSGLEVSSQALYIPSLCFFVLWIRVSCNLLLLPLCAFVLLPLLCHFPPLISLACPLICSSPSTSHSLTFM